MANFPTVFAQASTSNAATNANLTMPAFNAGMLLLANTGSMTSPTGVTSATGGVWSLLGSVNVGSTTFARTWAKVAAVGDTCKMGAGFGNGGFITAIDNWSGNIADIGFAGIVGSLNCPALNMGTAKDYLWVVGGSNYQNVMGTAPSGYGNIAQATFNTSPAGDHKLSLARKTLTAASDDPATWSGTANTAGSWTVAIPGPAAGRTTDFFQFFEMGHHHEEHDELAARRATRRSSGLYVPRRRELTVAHAA